MSVSPQEIANEARLCRQSGHEKQSARLLSLAKNHFPAERCLVDEERRLVAGQNKRLKSLRRFVTGAVDLLTLPVFVLWCAIAIHIVVSLLFVPAG